MKSPLGFTCLAWKAHEASVIRESSTIETKQKLGFLLTFADKQKDVSAIAILISNDQITDDFCYDLKSLLRQ